MRKGSCVIVLDFDGTCVKHAYPAVGKDIGAEPVLKRLVANGCDLVLSTMRSRDSEGGGHPAARPGLVREARDPSVRSQ